MNSSRLCASKPTARLISTFSFKRMANSPSYMTRETLSELLQSSSKDSIAIIDVRDDDYVGGHIKGSKNVPTSTLDYRVPELVRTLKGKEKVVFHCALSQQRGPAAARRYATEKAKSAQIEKNGNQVEGNEGENEGNSAAKDAAQQVYILDGGFNKWQEK